jgi:hypothetical protein
MSGLDAFEELKALAAKATAKEPPKPMRLPAPSLGDPDLEKQRLVVTAREGLPVAGTAASWEALRPKVVGKGEADKVGRLALGVDGGGGGGGGMEPATAGWRLELLQSRRAF